MPDNLPVADASNAKPLEHDRNVRFQMTADMIASNIAPENRVAPSLDHVSVIRDLYAFAERLRAGTIRGVEPKT